MQVRYEGLGDTHTDPGIALLTSDIAQWEDNNTIGAQVRR